MCLDRMFAGESRRRRNNRRGVVNFQKCVSMSAKYSKIYARMQLLIFTRQFTAPLPRVLLKHVVNFTEHVLKPFPGSSRTQNRHESSHEVFPCLTGRQYGASIHRSYVGRPPTYVNRDEGQGSHIGQNRRTVGGPLRHVNI